MTQTRLPYPVPYYAQVASPELAARIFSGELDPKEDPHWKESGAATVEEYAYWVERACGAACVKMCVEALGGRETSLVGWAKAGAARGGYLIETVNGIPVERGWLHLALAEMITTAGFFASAQQVPPEEIEAQVRLGRLVIASVSWEIGDEVPITRKGGHLVVVTGIETSREGISGFIVHNPSGRTKALQAEAFIPYDNFNRGYSGRAIIAGGEQPQI